MRTMDVFDTHLHNLVLVFLGSQDERGDVGRELRLGVGSFVEAIRVPQLPALLPQLQVAAMLEDGLGDLDVTRADGLQDGLVDVVLARAVQEHLHDLAHVHKMNTLKYNKQLQNYLL